MVGSRGVGDKCYNLVAYEIKVVIFIMIMLRPGDKK